MRGRVEYNCVGCVCVFGVNIVDGVAAIVFQGRSNIPAVMAVGRPGSSLLCFVMGYDFDAWWGHRCCLEVKASIQVFVCGEFRVHSGSMKEVESEFGLWE